MKRRVVLRPSAEADLIELYHYIAEASCSAEIGFAYAERVRAACFNLVDFSERGSPRDDVLPGLRIVAFEKRTVIAYRIVGNDVEITNLFHGRRDWEALVRGK